MKEIFGAYDIRGVYGKNLDEDIAEKIGLSFGTFLGSDKRILVGMDVRESSENLKESLIEGILRTGNKVVDIGLTATPAFYYVLVNNDFDGGVMVTASHNPPEWNGFKLYDSEGLSYGADYGMKEIREIFENERFNIKSKGYKKEFPQATETYLKFLIERFKHLKDGKLEIVADLGNGCACLILPRVFKKLRMRCEFINEEVDGRFPNRSPEPKDETLTELKKRIIEKGAEFGMGFDGDGDRCVFVDGDGRVITGDRVLGMFVKDYGKRQQNLKVVFEVSCGQALREIIKKVGAIGIESRVGRTFIINLMKKENADVGGEYSSHFYFKELKGGDDGLFAALKFYETVLQARGLKKLLSQIPLYPKLMTNVEVDNSVKFDVIEEIKKMVEGKEVVTIDGVKVMYPDGWYLIRASNTQPLLRITVEAKEEERLEELKNEAIGMVRKALQRISS